MRRLKQDFYFFTSLISIVIVSLIIIALIGSKMAFASGGRKSRQVEPVFRDEGDKLNPFSVACTTFQWNVVVASEPVSRSRVLYAPTTNLASVCLSTYTIFLSTNSRGDTTPCNDSTSGVELTAGSFLTDYGSTALNCKSRVAASSSTLKGWYMTDKGDAGGLGN